jgi:hypothetical protein
MKGGECTGSRGGETDGPLEDDGTAVLLEMPEDSEAE